MEKVGSGQSTVGKEERFLCLPGGRQVAALLRMTGCVMVNLKSY